MIKSLLLNNKCRTLARRERPGHTSYEEASSIGILFHSGEFEPAMISEVTRELEADGKQVISLAYNQKADEWNTSYCKKDLTLSGKFTKKSVLSFSNQPFDFLISLDTSGDIYFKYVLAASKAACKIGISAEVYEDLLQLSVKPSMGSQEGARDVVRYLKMIRNE